MSKKSYLVGVREVHVATIRVTASNKIEAIERVRDYGLDAGDELSHEYSHRLDSSTWTIELEKKRGA